MASFFIYPFSYLSQQPHSLIGNKFPLKTFHRRASPHSLIHILPRPRSFAHQGAVTRKVPRASMRALRGMCFKYVHMLSTSNVPLPPISLRPYESSLKTPHRDSWPIGNTIDKRSWNGLDGVLPDRRHADTKNPIKRKERIEIWVGRKVYSLL